MNANEQVAIVKRLERRLLSQRRRAKQRANRDRPEWLHWPYAWLDGFRDWDPQTGRLHLGRVRYRLHETLPRNDPVRDVAVLVKEVEL
jgi:hypothetical protein